ncbi:polyphenol oxidase family protein [Nesterenkonia sp. NBAIMH1]|uniref:polyphenol oxidase family protein n=1 Tax=Nesterenkonia sp. NBAIMH1 TaxID=2600320 RepID=UPI0011B8557B|nr:polyphenol oxidase family protein [Nesterenkonia sp. NBAIMH1]
MFYWRGEHEGVQLGFTSAEAGNLAAHVGSADAARRNRVALERVTGSLRFLNQTHSADVHDALEPTDSPPSGDAWVCEDGSVSLAVAVADCLPVLLVGGGPRGPVTAAAHAGRSGLMAGVLENTVRAMRQRRAQSIRAWIGPGACGSCYEVPQEMVNDLASHRPGLASLTRWGTPALDLRAHAAALLEEQSVDVHDVGGCTIEEARLFSHRAAQSRGAPEGRLAGVVWKP